MTTTYSGRIVWPFAEMLVGDWFDYQINGYDARKAQQLVSARAVDSRCAGRGPRQFKTTRKDAVIRVERVS